MNKKQKELASKLSSKQLKFANLVLLQDENKLTIGQCYEKAGYKTTNRNSSESKASRALKEYKYLGKYIDLMKIESAKSVGLTLEYLDKKLFDMLEMDAADAIKTAERTIKTPTGEETVIEFYLKDHIENLDPVVRKSIQSIKRTKEGITIELPKTTDLMRLGYQRKGGLIEKHEVTGKDGAPVEVIDKSINPVDAAKAYMDMMNG